MFIPPMLCLTGKRLPSGEQWEYELKLDGYRVEAVKHESVITLSSQNEKRLTARYPGIVTALEALGMKVNPVSGELEVVWPFRAPPTMWRIRAKP